MVLDWMKELGSADDLPSGGIGKHSFQPRPLVNAHIHLPPNFSAFDSIRQVIELAEQQDVRVLGVSNYYDFSVYQRFEQLSRRAGIFPFFGLEIIAMEQSLKAANIRVNDPGNPGKFYICGKGITEFMTLSPKAGELMGLIRQNDIERITKMITKMEEIFSNNGAGTNLTYEKIVERVAGRHGCDPGVVYLQERHVARAFQEIFFEKVPAKQRPQKLQTICGSDCPKPDDPVTVQGFIRSNLMKAGKPCFVKESFVSLSQAKELIAELGGIVCYPVLADGAKKRCEWELSVDGLINSLKENNIQMAEFIPIRNSPETLSEYVVGLREAGIAIVAGTEHNTLDMLPLEPECAGGENISEPLKDIFLEGACVVAAHTFLRFQGKGGFEDSAEDYTTANKRIESFAKLGEQVIQRYFSKVGS